MKKITSLVLAVSLALSVAACGTKAPVVAETPAETKVEAPAAGLTGEITVQVEESWLPYYEAAVTRFKTANPEAKVTLINSKAVDMLDVLDKTDPSNVDVADVFAIPADRVYGMAENESLAPIDATALAATIGGYDNFDEGLGGNFNIDGDYLAFPMNIETLILFANTKNATAAGVDLTKPVELADAKTNDVLIPAFNAWYGVAILNSSEIELLGKKDDGTLFSDFTAEWKDFPAEKQATFTALFNYWKGIQDEGTGMWDNSTAWGYMDTEFASGGKTSLRIEGPWDNGKMLGLAADGADMEVLPIGNITAAGKPLKHWKGGWGLAVNARNDGDEAKMALSEAFIAELMNTEFATDFWKTLGKIMPNVEADVYLNSDLTDTDKAVIENVLASYEGATARPLFTEWGSVWDTWQNAVLSWSSVKPATAEAAYTEVKAAFDAMMLTIK
jgi:arabinogalactan oligomer/maltooligosaccharide transport system substrate-binding protein